MPARETGSSRGASGVLLLAGLTAAQEPAVEDMELEPLLRMLADPQRAVEAQVELASRPEAMAALGEAVVHSVPRLPDRLEDPARWAALEVLAAEGPRALPALPALVDALGQWYLPEAMMAPLVAAVGRIGMHAGPGREELRTTLARGLLPDGRPLRPAVKRHLDKLTTVLSIDGTGSWKDLRRELRSPHPLEFIAACEALHDRSDELAGLREEVKEVLVPFLERGAFERDWLGDLSRVGMRTVLTRASETLARYQPDHPATWLGWCQKLFHYDPAQRVAAVRALGRLRQPDALRWLLEAAQQGPEPVALAVMDALRRFGPAARYRLRELRALLPHLGDDARRQAELLLLVLSPSEPCTHTGPAVEFVGVGVDGPSWYAGERERLERWLDARQGGNRTRVQHEPVFIAEYHRGQGAADPVVRWVPARVWPDPGNPWRWQATPVDDVPGAVLVTDPGALGPDGERTARLPWLVYLLPVPADRPVFPGRITRVKRWDPHPEYAASIYFEPRPGDLAAWRGMLADVCRTGGAEACLVDGEATYVQRCRGDQSRRGAASQRVDDPGRHALLLERAEELAAR